MPHYEVRVQLVDERGHAQASVPWAASGRVSEADAVAQFDLVANAMRGLPTGVYAENIVWVELWRTEPPDGRLRRAERAGGEVVAS